MGFFDINFIITYLMHLMKIVYSLMDKVAPPVLPEDGEGDVEGEV